MSIICGTFLFAQNSFDAELKHKSNEPLTQKQFQKETKELMEYAYGLYNFYSGHSKSKPQVPAGNGFGNEKYDSLYVTFWYKGESISETAGINTNYEMRIFEEMEECIKKISNSVKVEPEKIHIVLDILHDEFEISDYISRSEKKDTSLVYRKYILSQLENMIEFGIDTIRLTSGKTATLLAHLPVINQLDTKQVFEYLCSKTCDDKNCYIKPDTKISILSALTLTGRYKDKANELLRYNIPVKIQDLTSAFLRWRLELAENWFYNNFNSRLSRPEYMYYPSTDGYDKSNNNIRQLAGLWIMARIKNFNDGFKPKGLLNKIKYRIKQYKFGGIIKKTLKRYLKSIGNKNYLKPADRATIAHNAFMILALCENYPKGKDTAIKLADAILLQQKPEGWYHTHFESPKNTGQDYYPGESMLALTKLYEVTKDGKYLNSVKKAFSYYRKYWRLNKTTGFIPWHSQAYVLLYEYTKDPEVANFVFEMNDWLVSSYQITDSPVIDTSGGFAKDSYPSNYSYVFMEGIIDAYKLALMLGDQKHINFYKPAVAYGIRFITQMQFTPESSFYLKNPYRAIGGFRTSIINPTIRVDNVQHAANALIKAYNLGNRTSHF